MLHPQSIFQKEKNVRVHRNSSLLQKWHISMNIFNIQPQLKSKWCKGTDNSSVLSFQVLPSLLHFVTRALPTLHLPFLKSGRGNLIINPAIALQPMWHAAKNCRKPPVTDCWVINRCRVDIAGVTRSCRAALQISDIYDLSHCSQLAGCPMTGSAQLPSKHQYQAWPAKET